jgi:YcaO-like protein with predicted kinase domain
VVAAPERAGTASPLWLEIEDAARDPDLRPHPRRAVPPRETLARLAPLQARAGITRLADITGLDRVGLPVYQAIRPNSRNLSVSQGKGLTRAQAKVSTLMESFEGFHAEAIDAPRRTASLAAMAPELGYDPRELLVDDAAHLQGSLVVEWIAATDLCTGAPTWLPAQLCELDFVVTERLHTAAFLPTSVGLAAGNTLLEALVHALCEVIERDACTRQAERRHDAAGHLALESIDVPAGAALLARLRRAGIAVHVLDATGPAGVPCFEVFLRQDDIPSLVFGSGCHPRRSVALLRALTEAAQARLTHIAGSRDDLVPDHYGGDAQAFRAPVQHSPFPAPRKRFGACPDLPARHPAETVRDLVARIARQTGAAPVAVDLRRADFGIPVVFVAAPGLRFSLLERIGPDAR